LTRPAVEAGEALGFLPGDLEQKILPYLRPLYDALREMLEPEEMERAIARQTIEVAPLAYMRGRTLSNAFVILDEAQNTTNEQMFMLLTRIGLNSKCVVTGDVTQIDLPANKRSGVLEALQALKNVPGIATVYFTGRDVVRHELVRAIIGAYQAHRGPAPESRT
jgi:phosphate starvation-inducible protein PhoH and related proteins